ncbi:ftsX-like permease family protein, partial [Vibrio parahaemolyticus VPTS-2010_2]
MFRFS